MKAVEKGNARTISLLHYIRSITEKLKFQLRW